MMLIPNSLAALTTAAIATCLSTGVLHAAPLTKTDISLVQQAVVDELCASLRYDAANAIRYGGGDDTLLGVPPPLFIEPAVADGDVVTHVLYPLPEIGYVFREVTILRGQRIAIFELGADDESPGGPMGFNCNRRMSNCRAHRVPARTLAAALTNWLETTYEVPHGPSSKEAMLDARKRNAHRLDLLHQARPE